MQEWVNQIGTGEEDKNISRTMKVGKRNGGSRRWDPNGVGGGANNKKEKQQKLNPLAVSKAVKNKEMSVFWNLIPKRQALT